MSFQKFEAVGAKLSCTISLTQSGGFGFSSGMYKKYNIPEFNFVTLFFDPDENKVGFQFSKERIGRSSFSIIQSDQRKSGSVVAKSFLKTFDIDPKKYRGRYEPAEYDDPQHGKIFYIVLSENNKK